MSKRTPNESFSDEESARRRDDVIKRMLNTPPEPHTGKPKPKPEKKRSEHERSRPKPRS